MPSQPQQARSEDRLPYEKQDATPCRLKATVQYDGTDYNGWQTQPQGSTIQDYLENKLSKMLGTRIHVAASGRTDAGVHAKGQVFHFELPAVANCDGLLPPRPADGNELEQWYNQSATALARALSGLSENTGLPPSIQVCRIIVAGGCIGDRVDGLTRDRSHRPCLHYEGARYPCRSS